MTRATPERVLDRVRGHAGTAERGRLVYFEGVCPGPDVHLGNTDQRSMRAEDRLRVASVVGDGLARVRDQRGERHSGPPDAGKRGDQDIFYKTGLHCQD